VYFYNLNGGTQFSLTITLICPYPLSPDSQCAHHAPSGTDGGQPFDVKGLIWIQTELESLYEFGHNHLHLHLKCNIHIVCS
jgi:hypothetical protein